MAAADFIRHSSHDAIDILQLNISSLNADMIKYILSKQYHVLLLQEHRLRGHLYHKAIHQLSSRYCIISSPAAIKHKMASGGCMTLVLKSLRQLPKCLSTECSMLRDPNFKVVLLRLKMCTLALCNIYLPPNNEHTKLGTMHIAAQYIQQLGCPWGVFGDFNMTPNELYEMNWSITGKGNIHVADTAKTVNSPNGRLIDYAVLDQRTQNMISCTSLVYDMPCKPHLGIAYRLSAKPRLIKIPQFIKPKSISCSGEKRNPAPFARCIEMAQNHKGLDELPKYMQEYVDCLPNSDDNIALGTAYKTVSAAYEIQLASRYCDWENKPEETYTSIGRANTPMIQERPLIPKKPPEHLVGDKACQVLNEIETRLKLLNGSMLEILDIYHGGHTNHGRREEAIRQIRLLKIPDKIDGIEHETLHKLKVGCRWVHRLQKRNVERLINIIIVAKQQRQKFLLKRGTIGFSEWVSNAFKKGAGAAHKWTSQKQKAPPLPTMIKAEDGKQLWEPKEKTAYLCNMWKGIWEKKHECTVQIQVWSRILEGMCKNEVQEPITASDIMQAAKLLRGSIGIDWWEVEHLKSMTEEVAQAFADILNQVEERVAWPVQTLLSLIVLMGKPNGGATYCFDANVI